MSELPLVFEATDQTFATAVVEASHEVAVVVDFWAPWCRPCHALSPILERVVESYGGRLRLAKVNVDESPGLAAQFGIRGIPAVKVFRDGKVAGEFTGAQPEAAVRRVLERVVPSETDAAVAEADALLAQGDREAAREVLEAVLIAEPKHPGAALRLAKLAAENGDTDAARGLASRVGEGTAEHAGAQALADSLGFAASCQQAGGPVAAAQRVEEHPDDLQARYDLACCQAAEGDYEGALDRLLGIVAADKTWSEGLAKDTMVRIFGIIGQRSPLADAYRQRLVSLLY